MRKTVLLTVMLAAASIGASARSAKISTDTPTRNTGAVEVIVQFKHAPNATHAAKILSRGGVLKTDLSMVNALHVSLPGNRLRDLSQDPEVSSISPDRLLKSSLSRAAIAVNAPYAWNMSYTGKGIAVGVVDS